MSAFLPKAGDFGSSYSFIKVFSMNLTMENVLIFFLPNPVVVVSSSNFICLEFFPLFHEFNCSTLSSLFFWRLWDGWFFAF